MVKTTEFNVQTQMNYVVGNMSGFTAAYTGMDNLSALISSLMTSYTTMAGTGRAAYLSLGAAVSAFGLKSSEAFGEYQRGMNMVKAISNNTNAQMQMLSQSAQQFSSQFRMGIEDINSGLVTLGRAGLTDVNNQIEVLKNGLEVAKISGMDLASTLEDIVTTTSLLGGDIKSNTFGAETKEVSNLLVATSLSGPLNVSDVIETLKFAGGSAAAAGAKLSNEEGLHDLLGTIGAFSQKGVTGSIAGTALRAFITKPASQDQKVSDALAKLGLDAYSLWEKDPEQGWHMKPIAEQIGLITKAMDKNHLTNLDRIEVWGDIVGNKMGQQMLKLDESRIKETTKDIEHQRNLEKIYQGTLTNFASQVERLNQIFQAIYRNFGSQFASTLTPIVNFLADVAEFVNGFGNGAIIKIIASAVGPLGLAGLAKGLRDFIQVLGALRANIIESSEKSLGSQDLWVAQRGVIEKRMNKGETIIAHDEWDSFLKRKSSRTHHGETDEEYQARMAKREADYKARQDARDKDYKDRQQQRDEDYQKRQAERTAQYQDYLNKLGTMRVGANIVQVTGTSVFFDGNGINFGEYIEPMSQDVAREIRKQSQQTQNNVQHETVSQLSNSLDPVRRGINHIIPQLTAKGESKFSTAFSKVDRNSIMLSESAAQGSVFSDDALNYIINLEKRIRAGQGILAYSSQKGKLLNYNQDVLNELFAVENVREDFGSSILNQDARNLLKNVLANSGMRNIKGADIDIYFNEQLQQMMHNFVDNGFYDDIFEITADNQVGVKKGQQQALAEQLSKRVMNFIGSRFYDQVNLMSLYQSEFEKSDIFKTADANGVLSQLKPLQKTRDKRYQEAFDEFIQKRLIVSGPDGEDYKFLDDRRLRDLKKNNYNMRFTEFAGLGLDMVGHNAYLSGLQLNHNLDPGIMAHIAKTSIYSHLGLIAQDEAMGTEILDLMLSGLGDSDGSFAKGMKAEIEDLKNSIGELDLSAEIQTNLTQPMTIAGRQFVLEGIRRTKQSPGIMAQAVESEMADIRNALNQGTEVIEEQVKQLSRVINAPFIESKAVTKNNPLFSAYGFTHNLSLATQTTPLPGAEVFTAQPMSVLAQQEFARTLSATSLFATQVQERMKYAGQGFTYGWQQGTFIFSPGLVYALTKGEFEGLVILLNRFKSTINAEGKNVGSELVKGFKESKGKLTDELLNSWIKEGYITKGEKATLSEIKPRALQQLYSKTGSEEHGLLKALEDGDIDDIKVRRFQQDEKIKSMYNFSGDPDERLPNGQYVVVDVETNTTTANAEHQITEYAQLDGATKKVSDFLVRSAKKIQDRAALITGVTNEMRLGEDALEEHEAYDKLATNLLTAVNENKAIVAHNTSFDKSSILMNLTRIASQGLLDDKRYTIGSNKNANIYDVIDALDKADWFDTLAELERYKYATSSNGEYIFLDDDVKGKASINNVSVYEGLTGEKVDRSKVHRAGTDVKFTDKNVEKLAASKEGSLLQNTVYAREIEEAQAYLKNFDTFKEDFFDPYRSVNPRFDRKGSLANMPRAFNFLEEVKRAERIFGQVYDEYGLANLDSNLSKPEDIKQYEAAKRRFHELFNQPKQYSGPIDLFDKTADNPQEFVDNYKTRTQSLFKLLEDTIKNPQRILKQVQEITDKQVNDIEEKYVEPTINGHSGAPLSRTPGSGKGRNPLLGIKTGAALRERDIAEQSHTFDSTTQPAFASVKSSLVQDILQFIESDRFIDFYKANDNDLIKSLETFEYDPIDDATLMGHLQTLLYDNNYIGFNNKNSREELISNLKEGKVGYKSVPNLPHDAEAKAILQAIKEKVGFSNIMLGSDSIEDLYNEGMKGNLSQSEILNLAAGGKFYNKSDSLGYMYDGEFHPTVTIDELSPEDAQYVSHWYERLKEESDHDFTTEPKTPKQRMARQAAEKKAMNEAIHMLSQERFEDNKQSEKTPLEEATEELHKTNNLSYYRRRSDYNKAVMNFMEKSVKDLVDDYNLLSPEEKLSYNKPTTTKKEDQGSVSFEDPNKLAGMVEEKLMKLESAFYQRFENGAFYYSTKVGGDVIGDSSYHTFEDLPMVGELMQVFKDLKGESYGLKKTAEQVHKDMDDEFLKIDQGKEAQKELDKLDQNNLKNTEKIRELERQINIGKQAEDRLSKIKEAAFIDNVHRKGDFAGVRAARYFAESVLDAEPNNLSAAQEYVLKEHGSTTLGQGALNVDEISSIINNDIKALAQKSLDKIDNVKFADDAISTDMLEKQFIAEMQQFPRFVQEMIDNVINKSYSFEIALRTLGEEGIKGFKDGINANSPPKLFTQFIGWVAELPGKILSFVSPMKQAGHAYGQAFTEGATEGLKASNSFYPESLITKNASLYQKAAQYVGFNPIEASKAYQDKVITQNDYINSVLQSLGLSTERKLMTDVDYKTQLGSLRSEILSGNVSHDEGKHLAKQIIAQYEDDQRVQGIRDRAISNEQFTTSVKALEAQYKNSTITLEEYIEETMRLMGVEERRLMTEDDLANKLIDIKNKLAAGEITEVEAEQGSANLINQFEDDKGTLKQNEIKQKRQDRINKGGIRGAAWGRIYNVTDSISKIGGIGGLANSLFSFMMNPIVMLGQMIMGWLQQFFDMVKQAEQEKIAKLSEILSDAASAFEDQQSKWEEAQSKNNEKFNDLSDNEKQDQMLDAIANARDDLNNASAETKVLLGKQNALITANNNMIQTKSDQWLTGFNGWEANYTEFMEGSGMYGTRDEYGFMDFLEGIVNPDKFADNSNTRRIEALAESSIQIDTRVKNMEEFTEDYQQVMASLGIAGRSILDIYNVRGIIDESLMSGTFFDQSASNQMRIGAPGLMSAEKLAGLMKTQEKILTRFENRYLRFVRTSTGQGNRIGVTLGDGSIHQLANQLGVKDIEAAQMLAVHELQRIQDVMINQVAPQLSEQTLSLYNGTYDLSQQTQYDDVQTAFQNTMQQGIWAIQAQVAQLVYKATMEQALADYQAETGDTETDTIGLLLNRARDTTYEYHDAAQKYASRGWGSFLEGRDINKLVNEGYTQEQAIQKLAEEKGVSVDKLTEAYAKENYDKLSEYEYNGQEEWLKRHAGQFLTIGGTIVGAAVGTMAMPGVGTALGIEAGSAMGTILGGTAGKVIGGGIGAAAGAGISSGIMDGYQNAMGSWTDFSDPFTEHTNEMMKSYAASVPIDETIKTLNDAQTAADEEGDNGKDTDDSDANKQRYVQLAICNKKAIPKLNVNLFKKAPTFTVLNKNFKLRDIKINTADKAKNIENSLKNAIIDVQERSDPKIIQDSEGEYDPVGATDDATNLPTGASLTK